MREAANVGSLTYILGQQADRIGAKACLEDAELDLGREIKIGFLSPGLHHILLTDERFKKAYAKWTAARYDTTTTDLDFSTWKLENDSAIYAEAWRVYLAKGIMMARATPTDTPGGD